MDTAVGFGAGGSVGFSVVTTGPMFGAVTGGGGTGGIGACCFASGRPACEDPKVASCVCSRDAFCCQQAWDAQCVTEVDALGCGSCQAQFGSVSGTFGFASSGDAVTVGGISTGAVSTTGGRPNACCQEGMTAGCDDMAVMACVCKADPYCCNVRWDQTCVADVEDFGCDTCQGSVGAGGAFGQAAAVTVTGAGGASTFGATSAGGEGGSGGVAECLQQANSDCDSCLCSGCFSQYGACIGDFGCPIILQCFDQTGCNDLDCTLAECQPVIDRYGGLSGASMRYALTLLECASDQMCPCE